MGIEHPVVREAINQVSKRGTPVVTIISDVSHCDRAAFVGLVQRLVVSNAVRYRTAYHEENLDLKAEKEK